MTAITRRRPGSALTVLESFYRPMSLFDEIEELRRRRVAYYSTLIPHIDMYEENGQLIIKTELTGVKKEDLDINLEGDTLTIKAEKKREEVAEDTTHYTSERYFGRYYRSTSLPFHVDGDKISATFENGVLELRLPKAEKAKTRQIEVKAQFTESKEKKRPRKHKQTVS